jgi:hypothetical protein
MGTAIWHDQHRERLLNSMTLLARDRYAAEEITSKALTLAFRNLKHFRGDAWRYDTQTPYSSNPCAEDFAQFHT